MFRTWLLGILSLVMPYVYGQSTLPLPDSLSEKTSMYKVNPWISGGISLLGLYTNSRGLKRLRNAPPISEERLNRLNGDDVFGLDRIALRQDPSKDKTDRASKTSDLLLFTGAGSPVLLFLDRSIRKQWLDVTLMYLESQAVTSNFYSWGPLGPTFAERLRPAAYYTELPLEQRETGNNRNSFYSGHVASTATGWFFTAKVLNDFHPEWGGKKWLLYGLATVPVTLVAIERIRALRHFPTDTIIGGVVGAAVGILIPTIHKRTKGKLSVGAVYNNQMKGLAVGWKW